MRQGRNEGSEIKNSLDDSIDMFRAQVALRKADSEMADILFKRLGRLSTEDPLSMEILDLLYRERHNYAYVKYHYWLSLACRLFDRNEQFLEVSRTLADSGFAPSLNQLGQYYWERGDRELAQEYFTHAKKLNFQPASSFYYLGLSDESRGLKKVIYRILAKTIRVLSLLSKEYMGVEDEAEVWRRRNNFEHIKENTD